MVCMALLLHKLLVVLITANPDSNVIMGGAGHVN